MGRGARGCWGCRIDGSGAQKYLELALRQHQGSAYAHVPESDESERNDILVKCSAKKNTQDDNSNAIIPNKKLDRPVYNVVCVKYGKL